MNPTARTGIACVNLCGRGAKLGVAGQDGKYRYFCDICYMNGQATFAAAAAAPQPETVAV